MGASIGSGPKIGPPMGAQLVARATSPVRASQVIPVDHRRPFEADLGNAVRARVERTFAWLGRCRRLAKDFGYIAVIALAFLRLGMIRPMLLRVRGAKARAEVS
jgi:transposase